MRSLWTLTYALEPVSRAQVVGDLREFFEQVRRHYGRMPLVAVIERGAENGRLHVHFAANRWIKKRCIFDFWHRGWVHVRGRSDEGYRWAVKRLARYLAKYVSKSLDDGADGEPDRRPGGAHRYLLTQGFTPTAWTWRFRHADYAWAMAELCMGEPESIVCFGEKPEAIVSGWWLDWPDPPAGKAGANAWGE